MRGRERGSWHPHLDGVGGGHRLLLLVVIAALVAGACTGAPVKLDPPNTPNAVVSSADRIRDGQARLGGSTACLEDAYCAAGLSRVYGMPLGSGGVVLDTPSSVVEALVAGAIDIGALPAGAVEADDPRISVLRDDRQLAPADNVIPVVSGALSTAGGPSLIAAVDTISGELGPAGLTTIERALAGGAPPELAAQTWLQATTLRIAPAPIGAPHIVLGYRDDEESQTLSDLYAGALQRAGWPVSVTAVGGGRSEELDLLHLGRVGLVPDLTTDLLQQLDGFTGQATADLQRDVVLLRSALADRGLVALAPAGAGPATVFAVSGVVAAALSVRTLSALAGAAKAHPPGPPTAAPLTPAEVATDTEGPPPAVPASLGVGSVGPVVLATQQRLAALGYFNAPISGVYDEATRRAVSAFQLDEGLLSDGEDDAETARLLATARPTGRPSSPALPGDDDTVRVPASAPDGSGAGAIYLAFAGGPSSVTPQILSLLQRVGGTATFFVEQAAAAAAPETLRDVQAAGDAVGVTADPHNSASPIATDALFRTLAAAQEAAAAVIGRTPTCVLAPYGSSDPATRARATAAGLHTVVWDVDPQDWRHPGSPVIATDVISNARPGSIVLLHDGGGDRAQTVTALEAVLSSLTGFGYRFSAIPGC